MTHSNYNKVFKQLDSKPGKMKKYIKNNAPKKRTCGYALIECELCGRHKGVVQKYKLNLCRQCFRQNAPRLGFKKYH